MMVVGQTTHMSSNGLKFWKNIKESILDKMGWTTLQILDQWNSRLEAWMQGNSRVLEKQKSGRSTPVFWALKRKH